MLDQNGHRDDGTAAKRWYRAADLKAQWLSLELTFPGSGNLEISDQLTASTLEYDGETNAAEESRLEILERLHDGRTILVEEIRQATEFITETDKQIAELERAAL